MLHYIIQVVCFQLIFLIIYDTFLRKETFFNANRIYLVGTAVISLILPFVKIPRVKEVIAEDFTIILPQVIIGDPIAEQTLVPTSDSMQVMVSNASESMSIWTIIFIIGILITATVFLLKLGKLIWMMRTYPSRWQGNVLIIKLVNSSKAFSFFNRIFLGQQLQPNERSSIIKHELVHVKQLHSLDLLFFELLRIVFWFNPLIYIYHNRIATLHEFIADSKAVKHQNKSDYYNELLSQVFDTNTISFVNPFFKQSLIKKRILMLNKSRSKQINMMKYALLIPLIFVMLIYTSSYAQNKPNQLQNESSVSNQQNDDDVLKQRLYNELVTMENEGKTFKEITDFVLKDGDKYIMSKEEYYRFQMYTKLMADKMMAIKSEQGTLTDEVIESNEKLTSKVKRSYDEYLSWKKSDEAKLNWESKEHDGILRLVVDNPEQLTSEEEDKFHSKLDQLENDPKVKGVLMVSSDGKSKLMIHDSETIKKAIQQEQIKGVPEGKVEVPFGIIDEIPMLPECENLDDANARKKCVAQEIAKHVNAKFNTKLATQLGLSGRQRINVMFKIDKQGNVGNVRARAANAELEKEAIRVISLLPKFKPGKHKGEPVIVPYSLPILFQVNAKQGNDPSKPYDNTVEEASQKSTENSPTFQNVEVPYNAVDEVPYLPECESTNNQDERKKCVSQAVAKFVNLNFDMDLAASLDLIGVQRINTIFKIDTAGNVVDIKARAPHPDLEEEAIRVISELPTFIPGKDDGKTVSVVYALPIKFEVVGKKRKRKKKN